MAISESYKKTRRKTSERTIEYWFAVLIPLLTLISKFLNWIEISSFELYLILICTFVLLIPYLPRYFRKIKISSILEAELNQIKETQEVTYNREVIEIDSKYYYIDQKYRYRLTDIETANFLASNKGRIYVKNKIVKKYKDDGEIESVKTAKLYICDKTNAVYIILNNKKLYIGNMNYLYQWGRTIEEAEKISFTDLNLKYKDF